MAEEKEIRKDTEEDDNNIFEDAEALTALIKEAFASAVQEAIAENDALGIAAPYSRDGKIYFRQPKPKDSPK